MLPAVYLERTSEKVPRGILAGDKVGVVLDARQVGKATLEQHVLGGQPAVFLNFDAGVRRGPGCSNKQKEHPSHEVWNPSRPKRRGAARRARPSGRRSRRSRLLPKPKRWATATLLRLIKTT